MQRTFQLAFPAAYASLPKKAGGACGFDQPKIDGGDNQLYIWLGRDLA